MKHRVPMTSRSGSGLSQSGGEGRPPLVDLTGDTPPEPAEPAVDLDKTIEMREGVDASEQEDQARVWEGPERPVSDASTSSKKNKKSKQARTARRAEGETR